MSSDSRERVLPAPLLWDRRDPPSASASAPSSPSAPLAVHNTLSDEDLLRLTELGDQGALSELFVRYADVAFAISLRILRDRGESEDLVQDIFLKLFRTRHSFDPARGSARTWIIQFIYGRAFNRRSYLARRHFYSGTDAVVGTDLKDSRNALQEGGSSSLEDDFAARVTATQVMSALGELTDQQRKTIEMHFFDGASLREISEQTGESFENIRHHYYRGLERLKRIALNLTGRRQK